jgi:2-furoyl-CoA dehydrogenase large subunit
MTGFPSATERQTGHIGAPQTRAEDAALLRGLGCYADDAAISPGHAHARITFGGLFQSAAGERCHLSR